MADTYGYKIVTVRHAMGQPYEAPEQMLNDLGAEGWEAYQVIAQPSFYEFGIVHEIYYLKNKKA